MQTCLNKYVPNLILDGYIELLHMKYKTTTPSYQSDMKALSVSIVCYALTTALYSNCNELKIDFTVSILVAL